MINRVYNVKYLKAIPGTKERYTFNDVPTSYAQKRIEELPWNMLNKAENSVAHSDPTGEKLRKEEA